MSLLSRKRALRIAYGRVAQETNALSPVRTTLADFHALHYMEGRELEGAVSLSVTGETTDEPAAKNLADVVRGLAALVQLQAAQKPEWKELGSAINVSTSANTVLLSARFSYDLIDSLQPKHGEIGASAR